MVHSVHIFLIAITRSSSSSSKHLEKRNSYEIVTKTPLVAIPSQTKKKTSSGAFWNSQLDSEDRSGENAPGARKRKAREPNLTVFERWVKGELNFDKKWQMICFI